MSETTPHRLHGITRRVTDLVAVVGVVAVTALVVGLDGPTVLRVPAALLSVVVLPGYACTVALFPVEDGPATVGTTHGGISRTERAVLTVGLSLAIVALSGLALDWLVGRLTTTTLLWTVVAVTLGLAAVAAVRRRRVPDAMRYAPSLETVRLRAAASGLNARDPLTVLLVLCVLFAGGAIAAPQPLGEDGGVTELYLLSEGPDGALGTAEYPTTVTAGTGQPITVAVERTGGESRRYTVVGQLQRAERGASGPVVRDRTRIATWTTRVGPGERQLRNETVTVGAPGSYRLVYLLYRGDAPANPRIDTADREVHLWLTVTEGA